MSTIPHQRTHPVTRAVSEPTNGDELTPAELRAVVARLHADGHPVDAIATQLGMTCRGVRRDVRRSRRAARHLIWL